MLVPMEEHTRHTHTHGAHKLRYGSPLPFGTSTVPGGVNFSVFSIHATACTLVLFDRGAPEPFEEIPFPEEFRMGHVWAMVVLGLEPGSFEYGYRFDGPDDPRAGHRFDPSKVLMDPYAREIGGDGTWRGPRAEIMPFRGRHVAEVFDWEHARPLHRREEEMIIYEMHLRGFTAHPSSGVSKPGTFAAMIEKIPYLLDLGVNCVELMPVFEFDELENTRTNPVTGEPLCNYWGYSTLGFFSPKAAYAGGARGECSQVRELKALVRALHEAGIEVILDVVFNHTGEGGEGGPTYSFRGIDNRTYYILDSAGGYANYSGCGNTLNCNHPAVRGFVIGSLRHWASEYHIDGFRFDLASVLGRDSSGAPLANPPLLEALAYDPVLAHCDLIAEAWDAGGLYQVGNFPAYGRWMEWNGKFRDAVRRFLRGDTGMTGEMVQRIMGSPDLYAPAGRKPSASVNFITCHDGFTLRDMVSYNAKHNLENGEHNRDGSNDNRSWNCGVEGETDDPGVNALRLRQQKNAFVMLFVSQGVPMFPMGDEYGRTQRGNNNAYCHDEPWNWFDWDRAGEHGELFRFVRLLIAFRKANAALRQPEFLTGRDRIGSGYPDISWHGVEAWKPDWSPPSRTLAFLLCGRHAAATGAPPHFIYCAFNMFDQPLDFALPVLPRGMAWHLAIDTARESPADIVPPGEESPAADRKSVRLAEHNCTVLLGK
jgi:isoamylase